MLRILLPLAALVVVSQAGLPAAAKAKFLSLHNMLRKHNRQGDIAWDDGVAAKAAATAASCEFKHGAGDVDSYYAIFGKAIGTSLYPTAAKLAMQYWYTKPTFGDCVATCGQKENIIVPQHSKVGCAIAPCPGFTAVYCDYA